MKLNEKQIITVAKWTVIGVGMIYLNYALKRDAKQRAKEKERKAAEKRYRNWERFESDMKRLEDDLDARIETAKFWLLVTEQDW